MMKISLRKLERPVRFPRPAATQRKGVALVEVIVAMVLLAIAVSSLAALMYSVSQQGMVATGNAYRNGVLMQEVNRLEGVPYDSIPTGTSSASVASGAYPHGRVVTVTEPVAGVMKSIKVIITPTNKKYRPDTVSFTRTKARTTHVLCTTCPS
jgi:prepilin-type N-terminal cleavage/methylation domain-containing protein